MKVKHGGSPLAVVRTAFFSECESYRYSLKLHWGKGTRVVNWLMLNPSTADEMRNDPTIERCERRSREYGFDGLVITNLYALRSTDPLAMLAKPAPVSETGDVDANNLAIMGAAAVCEYIVCGWGGNARPDRVRMVLTLLDAAGYIGKLRALRIGVDGQPYHPLYVPYRLQPVPWVPAAKLLDR